MFTLVVTDFFDFELPEDKTRYHSSSNFADGTLVVLENTRNVAVRVNKMWYLNVTDVNHALANDPERREELLQAISEGRAWVEYDHSNLRSVWVEEPLVEEPPPRIIDTNFYIASLPLFGIF